MREIIVFPLVWGVTQACVMFFLLRVLGWHFFVSGVAAMTTAGIVAESARRWLERVSSAS